MNAKALKTLEYDKIIALLTNHATSAPGRKLCSELEPSFIPDEIERMQSQTADGLSRLFKKGSISFGDTYDVRGLLKRLEIGSSLNTRELLQIAKLLENAGRVRTYGKNDRDDAPKDSLSPMFETLEPVTSLSEEIRACILSEDEISDNASPALRQIRRSIKASGERIHGELTRLISSSAKDYLQDSLITTRDGRYCVPVKAGCQAQVPGIIHDQSSTGSTIFIEPASVVRLNNEIRELELKEQEEIEAILARISENAAQHTDEILLDFDNMVQLDFIFARASLAMEENASRPLINRDGIIDLRQARHPLIDKKKVVPIDIRLGEKFDLLVITGPNTGGKTVSLKTTGLLVLMGLSGLHIPAADRSRIALFSEVYADIGDEQSIEQSLSTFSSHMKNVTEFLKKADEDSLVLFDELGAGTDPVEGAALAASILMSLHKRHIRTIATTHYSELKLWALRTPGVINGACEFNVDTLSPTYRLLIGVPGKSNAFAISKKLGLPEDIIETARGRLSHEAESFEDVLADLEKKRTEMENERLEIEKEKNDAEKLRLELEEKKKQFSEKKSNLIEQSSAEAKRILQEAKDYADRTISWYTKNGTGTSMREMEEVRGNLREKIKSLDKNIRTEAPERASRPLRPGDLKIGDGVKVLSLHVNGTVSTLPDKSGSLYVTMGLMRTKVALSDLEKLASDDSADSASGKTGSGQIRMEKSAAVAPEINLLGKTVDEAVTELDKYLDDAYLAHLDKVRIVHGKGTGALRKGVHDYLRKQKRIAAYRLGEYGEGDTGVTIAEFRK
ncbi:MAG: endonuclease MutS2 [Lachnospiraceae bacterium]|jgi:DNA mismatch repair protein MutS2|nr:endonuclease MutS2 [Lachnospiraceae bacterium]